MCIYICLVHISITYFPTYSRGLDECLDACQSERDKNVTQVRFLGPPYILLNKCIGDATKAAACQSPNCINKQKKNKIRRKTICNMADGIPTPCNVACGSEMTCHGIRPNVRHIGILHLVRFWPYHNSRHVILHQSAKFHPNRTTLSRKMMSCRFSRWRISAILDFRGPVMGFLKSPCKEVSK